MEKLSRTQKLENLKSNVNEAEANQGFDFYNNQPLTGATAANQAPQFTQPMTNDSQQIFNPFATQTQPLVQQAPQAPSFVDPFAAPLQQQNVVPQFQNVEQQFGQQPVVNNQFSPYGPLAANQVTSAPTDFMSVPQAPQPTYTNQPLPPQQPFAGTDMFNQTANTVPPLGQFQVPPVAGNDSSYIDQVLREAKLNSIAQGERTAEDTNVNIIDGMIRTGALPPTQAPLPNANYYPPQANQVLPNPASTREADLAYENTVRQEAALAYQANPTTLPLDQQINLINNPNAAVPQTQAPVVYDQAGYPQIPQQPVTPPLPTAASGEAQPFVTGKLPIISDVQINTYVDNTESETSLDNVLQQRIQGDSQDITNRIIKYEGELDDVTSDVTYTNKVLNIILIFLILGLTVVLGVVIWWILTVRGII